MHNKKPPVPAVSPAIEQPLPIGGGLRIQEAAKYSGFTVSYIRTKIAEGVLLPARAGKRFLLTREQLDAHIAALQHEERKRRGAA